MRRSAVKDDRIQGTVEDLVRPPVILTVNEFTENSARKFHAGMSRAHGTGQPIVPVVIDSYGGDVYALLSMISAIQNSRLPVATVVEGKAQSCGASLFSCGAPGHRYMAPHASLMIHDMTHELVGKVGDTKSDQNHSDDLQDTVYRLMAVNCGHPPRYFLDLVHGLGHANFYLTAKQARRHNLCNHIRVPELKTTISVRTVLE